MIFKPLPRCEVTGPFGCTSIIMTPYTTFGFWTSRCFITLPSGTVYNRYVALRSRKIFGVLLNLTSDESYINPGILMSGFSKPYGVV